MGPEVVMPRRALLAEAAAALGAAGLPEPRREALRIWRDLVGATPADVFLRGDDTTEPEIAVAIRAAVRRRAAGEPLAYVTGQAGFRSLTLRVDRRALIPRPETEGLVDLLLARVRTGRVADVGTGTGCVALSLATEGGFDQVIATDLSAGALELAALNRSATGARVDLVRADLCGAFGEGALDAVVSNPPYLTAREYGALDPSVRLWEPESALVSGSDGLDSTGRLLRDARAVLRAGGWLVLEVDCTRAPAVAAQASALDWVDVAIHTDLFGRERYLLARRSALP